MFRTRTQTPRQKTTWQVPAQAAKSSMMRSRPDDIGIAIIDDDMQVDPERINEERRAYLEESRSQEVSD